MRTHNLVWNAQKGGRSNWLKQLEQGLLAIQQEILKTFSWDKVALRSYLHSKTFAIGRQKNGQIDRQHIFTLTQSSSSLRRTIMKQPLY